MTEKKLYKVRSTCQKQAGTLYGLDYTLLFEKVKITTNYDYSIVHFNKTFQKQ